MDFKYVELDGGNIKDLDKIFDDFKNSDFSRNSDFSSVSK